MDGNKNQTNINCDISDMWKQMIRMLFAAQFVQWPCFDLKISQLSGLGVIEKDGEWR